MKSIVGLLEYTVTGAFVWILFFVFMTIAAMGPNMNRTTPIKATEVWESWAEKIPSLPERVSGSVLLKETAPLVLGGALFIAIFATGLLLDLLAPVLFSVLEIRWAKKWLWREKRPWLDELTRENGELVAADYEALTKKGNLRNPLEWRIETYRRLTMFLTSYVCATSKSGQLEDFLDRLKVWRVSQAISLSLMLLFMPLMVWVLVTWAHRQPFEVAAFGFLLPLVLIVCSYLTMRTTFFRLVIALETAAYLGWKAAQQAARQPQQTARQHALAA